MTLHHQPYYEEYLFTLCDNQVMILNCSVPPHSTVQQVLP